MQGINKSIEVTNISFNFEYILNYEIEYTPNISQSLQPIEIQGI